jgi:hypothetical protein
MMSDFTKARWLSVSTRHVSNAVVASTVRFTRAKPWTRRASSAGMLPAMLIASRPVASQAHCVAAVTNIVSSTVVTASGRLTSVQPRLDQNAITTGDHAIRRFM